MPEFSPGRDPFRWTILALISISHIIGAAAQYGINTLAPFYQDELGLTRAQVGLFFSAFYLAMTGASFGSGWLADRFGVGQTGFCGHLLVGICTVAAALSKSFELACASFFLAGVGYSFLNPASSIGVMTWFHQDERATAMGAKQTGVPTGGVLVAIVAPSLVLVIGWRGALVVVGIVNFLFAFTFLSSWREPAGDSFAPEEERKRQVASQDSFLVWRLLPVSCATAMYLIGQMVLLTYAPLYLKDALGFSPYRASQALALTQAGAMIGRIGWGVASDRLFGGKRKIVLLIIGVFSVVSIETLALMNVNSSYYVALPILFVAGVCIVGYQGVSYALIGELAGKARTGAGLGMMITINAAAATVGTPVFGYIVDRTGSYPIGWSVLAATISAGVVALAILLKEPRRQLA
jgi:ACS family hexuronate transporter-like MFS transporter